MRRREETFFFLRVLAALREVFWVELFCTESCLSPGEIWFTHERR